MVSALTAAIFASAGFMVYLAIPALAMNGPIEIRERVGRTYYKLAAKSLKQFTLVRRVLSGYDILPISVDNEQKLLEATLSSSTISSDDKFRFADADNRIKRLHKKPLALTYEGIPAAIDASIAEWGHWVEEKGTNEGFWNTDYLKNPGDVVVDPYVEAAPGLRLVDPVDALNIIPNGVDPENIKTSEQLTKKRYEKYSSGMGLKQSLRVAMGFAIGAGGFVGVQYVNEKVLDGTGGGSVVGGGPNIVGNETIMAWFDPGVVTDVVVAIA